MSWVINKFESDDELVMKLAERIASDLRTAIAARGRATMAVSGGSTPEPLFAELARRTLPWEKITVTLVDERWVDEDHPDSNAKLVHDTLLQNRAAQATFIGLKTSAADPFSAQAEVETRLRDVPMPLDVVILGMGSDGHTASFFPGADTLKQALHPDTDQLCCAVRSPAAAHDRMTLTLPVLLSAGSLLLHIVGKDKWTVLQRALEPGKTDELPVRSVLHQSRKLLDIYYASH